MERKRNAGAGPQRSSSSRGSNREPQYNLPVIVKGFVDIDNGEVAAQGTIPFGPYKGREIQVTLEESSIRFRPSIKKFRDSNDPKFKTEVGGLLMFDGTKVEDPGEGQMLSGVSRWANRFSPNRERTKNNLAVGNNIAVFVRHSQVREDNTEVPSSAKVVSFRDDKSTRIGAGDPAAMAEFVSEVSEEFGKAPGFLVRLIKDDKVIGTRMALSHWDRDAKRERSVEEIGQNLSERVDALMEKLQVQPGDVDLDIVPAKVWPFSQVAWQDAGPALDQYAERAAAGEEKPRQGLRNLALNVSFFQIELKDTVKNVVRPSILKLSDPDANGTVWVNDIRAINPFEFGADPELIGGLEAAESEPAAERGEPESREEDEAANSPA